MIVWRKLGQKTLTRPRWAFCSATAHIIMSVLHRLVEKTKEVISQSPKVYKIKSINKSHANESSH